MRPGRRLPCDKFQRDAVDAVTESGRLRTVIEEMALVAAAAGTVHFGAGHEELRVGARLHHLRVDRLPEAGPAGAAVELLFRRIGGEIATRAVIDARGVILMQRTRKRPFRIFVAQHLIGRSRQLLLPFFVGFRHFDNRGDLNLGRHRASPLSLQRGNVMVSGITKLILA
ncbi:hypothetical protein NITLEN_30288 [Nitrospira lenta]|uniref:Uncharacterized protein n=1 Tax=Nitrospira lenta TaxID=1436998 RepID=A0A330L6P4_9BACT|nr:hypothetical protein NITLEN_30288 [Nitrospira lenta]